MAYRVIKGKGNWRIKRSMGTIAGVDIGKFNVVSGTENKQVADRIEEMMDALAEMGVPGATLLLEIAKKRRRPIDVYAEWKGQKVRDIPAIIGEEPLADAWNRFVETARSKAGMPIAPSTATVYRNKINALLALNPAATVRDLPSLLETYRNQCVEAGTFHSFNNTRKAALAFARNTQKDRQYSTLWMEIAKVSATPSATKKQNTALPVYDVRECIDRLPDARMKNVAWTLALTGMRISEYVIGWDVLDDRIQIHGTKTDAADRVVPRLSESLTPEPFYYAYVTPRRNAIEPDATPVNYDAFNRALRLASDQRLSAHDLRHSYRMWLDEADIPDLRADMYFGHATRGLKEQYARHQLDLRLEEDTHRMVQYLQAQWERPKTESKTPIQRLKLP